MDGDESVCYLVDTADRDRFIYYHTVTDIDTGHNCRVLWEGGGEGENLTLNAPTATKVVC